MDPFAYRDAMRQQDLSAAAAELRAFAAGGGSTVVDLGNSGYGRDAAGLAVLARLTGVSIVMGCGEYVSFGHSPYVRHVAAEVIRDVILDELVEGVGGTGVRAGVIGEIGTGNPPTPDELKVVRAAAMAHRETGVAVNLHRSIFPDPMAGLVAVDAALDAGVDPGKLIVSHCDERPEPEFALAVARRGAWVELDTFGMEQWAVSARSGDRYPQRALDRDRIAMLHVLLDAGFRDQVLLSHDMAMKPQLTSYGGWGLTHLSDNIEPRLRAEGIASDDLAVLRVANPARALGRPGPGDGPA
jgi:phosphotriesterase-related protein